MFLGLVSQSSVLSRVSDLKVCLGNLGFQTSRFIRGFEVYLGNFGFQTSRFIGGFQASTFRGSVQSPFRA